MSVKLNAHAAASFVYYASQTPILLLLKMFIFWIMSSVMCGCCDEREFHTVQDPSIILVLRGFLWLWRTTQTQTAEKWDSNLWCPTDAHSAAAALMQDCRLTLCIHTALEFLYFWYFFMHFVVLILVTNQWRLAKRSRSHGPFLYLCALLVYNLFSSNSSSHSQIWTCAVLLWSFLWPVLK